MQKPGEVDPIRRKRLTRFHLADVSERLCLLLTCRVPARIAAGHINDRGSLVLLLNHFGQISGDFNVIIGMTDDNQNVNFVAAVRLWDRRRGLRLSACNSEESEEK